MTSTRRSGGLLARGRGQLLDKADSEKLADQLREEIIGRNVLDGRWTYQIVEELDDLYYRPVEDAERRIRG